MELCKMKEIALPSGATLKISHTPFEVSLALNEAVIEELKGMDFSSETEMLKIYKDLFCIGFSSKKIKECLWKCFERCTYNSGKGDFRIDKHTFDPEESRQDYATVCMEVAQYNIAPFVKAHSAKFSQVLESLKSSPESKSQATPS
jgi:hypothetical protein